VLANPAALLTGRNHHAVGMGGIPEFSGGFPGYSAMLPRDAAPFPKILKENGYSTAGIGKWHLTPEKEQGPGWPCPHSFLPRIVAAGLLLLGRTGCWRSGSGRTRVARCRRSGRRSPVGGDDIAARVRGSLTRL
jgi:arylsulfatase A-like enzyme